MKTHCCGMGGIYDAASGIPSGSDKKRKTAMIFLCLSVCVEKLRITSEKGHTRRRNYKAI